MAANRCALKERRIEVDEACARPRVVMRRSFRTRGSGALANPGPCPGLVCGALTGQRCPAGARIWRAIDAALRRQRRGLESANGAAYASPGCPAKKRSEP